MKIRAGFRIGYECPIETPMLLVLKVHPSRERDLCSEQTLAFDRVVSQRDYLDDYGNACTRIVAPAGVTTISAQFEIFDSGLPEPAPHGAVQLPIQIFRTMCSFFCSAAAIATQTGWRISPGNSLPQRRSAGRA